MASSKDNLWLSEFGKFAMSVTRICALLESVAIARALGTVEVLTSSLNFRGRISCTSIYHKMCYGKSHV